MSWVYKCSERELYTVGFYDPTGQWHADSDHNSREEAQRQVNYLNGGSKISLNCPFAENM